MDLKEMEEEATRSIKTGYKLVLAGQAAIKSIAALMEARFMAGEMDKIEQDAYEKEYKNKLPEKTDTDKEIEEIKKNG